MVVPFVILTTMGTTLYAPDSRACGYHDPSHVAAGVLNWIYPNALYVRTAVWRAQDSGILPKRTKKARDLFAYQRMASRLQRLGQRLGPAKPGGAAPSFSAVLIDSILWSRFVPSSEGYRVEVHAKGPGPGDVVLVTDGRVVQALSDGSLDATRAEDYGLIRFYGPAADQRKVRRLLASALRVASEPTGESASVADRSPGQ